MVVMGDSRIFNDIGVLHESLAYIYINMCNRGCPGDQLVEKPKRT